MQDKNNKKNTIINFVKIEIDKMLRNILLDGDPINDYYVCSDFDIHSDSDIFAPIKNIIIKSHYIKITMWGIDDYIEIAMKEEQNVSFYKKVYDTTTI